MPSKSGQGKGRSVVLEDVAAIAQQAVRFVRHCAHWERNVGRENHIHSLTLYPPSQSRNGMWLVVGKAWSSGYIMVAFHRATDPVTALVGFLDRAVSQKIEWRRDSYSSERDRVVSDHTS